MKKIFQRRFPVYFAGFFLGLVMVMILMQVKKAVAPDFRPVEEVRPAVEVSAGGMLRLKLGEEPGRYLAWGFPTRLAVGKKGNEGRYEPVIRMEYKELVEKETLIGPITDAGEYELIGDFFACAYPGEKYCVKVQLRQPIRAYSGREAPSEAEILVDLKTAAEKAAVDGAATEKANVPRR